jgi:hypothetical protein
MTLPPGSTTTTTTTTTTTVTGTPGGSTPVRGGPNPANEIGQCFEAPNCMPKAHMGASTCPQCGKRGGFSWMRTSPPPDKCFNIPEPAACPR